MTIRERFAEYLRNTAGDAGYRVDRRRDRLALARAPLMPYDHVKRALDGQRLPDPVELEHLATALGQSLMQLLVDSGIVRPPKSEATR